MLYRFSWNQSVVSTFLNNTIQCNTNASHSLVVRDTIGKWNKLRTMTTCLNSIGYNNPDTSDMNRKRHFIHAATKEKFIVSSYKTRSPFQCFVCVHAFVCLTKTVDKDAGNKIVSLQNEHSKLCQSDEQKSQHSK